MAKKQYKKGHKVQLTKNFSSVEFDSKGNNTDDKWTIIDIDHVKKLQELRDILGKPCHITSAYRGPTHNKAVGGVNASRHLFGDATDIIVRGATIDEVVEAAERLNFKGIGAYNTFVHLDSRPGNKARWDFRKKK